MIKVDRLAPTPASLLRTRAGDDQVERTEEEAIISAYSLYVQTPHPDTEKFKFTFRAYSSVDVKAALNDLFHGKCAYCESRYAGTQPMDVEHWRPKGGVEEIGADGKKKLLDGYPWLAARWTNLLPSCIDCNRPRTQHDVVGGVKLTLGKANQFPVSGDRMRFVPGQPLPADDVALIIDPTVDDPAQHLRFRSDGAVVPIGPKGEPSIFVYALNRAELVVERLGLARLIEQRLYTIEALAGVIGDRLLPENLRRDLQDLVAHEINALLELADPGRPFSAMARQLIEENSPLQLSDRPAKAPWPQPVADMLQRFVRFDHGLDHHIVAARLAGLGFHPNLPPSAAYVRWTVTGTRRSVTLYQNSTGLVSDSHAQLDFAEALDGAVRSTGVHPKVRYSYEHSKLNTVLAATSAFRNWADGRDG